MVEKEECELTSINYCIDTHSKHLLKLNNGEVEIIENEFYIGRNKLERMQRKNVTINNIKSYLEDEEV